MAKAVVRLFVFVFLFERLFGEPSPDLNQKLFQSVLSGQTNKTVLLDFILFRNFRQHNLLSVYELASNVIAAEFPRVDIVKDRSALGIHFGKRPTDDEVIIQLDQPNEITGVKYDFITKYSESDSLHEKQRNVYQPFGKKVNDERDEKESNDTGMLLRQQSIGSDTGGEVNKINASVLDDVLDFLLEIVRDEIHKSGRDQIALPNVDEDFSTRIVFVPVKGHFSAFGGWFRNFSTLYRTGEVEITTSKNGMDVEFDLGLAITEFGYETYHAKLAGIQVTGTLTGSIALDSIATKISLLYVNGTCKAQLDSLKVALLIGIDVKLTGASGFGWLLQFIADCMSGKYRDRIIQEVEQTLSQAVEKKLETLNCGHLVSLTLNH